MNNRPIHLVDGTGAGGAEAIASLFARHFGQLVALEPPNPDLKRAHGRLLFLSGEIDGHESPGRRLAALKARVERLLALRAHAIVAHDPASHEVAALARAAGGPPVARVMHTSRHWTPDDHRIALDVLSPVTSIYFCVERGTHDLARRKHLRSFFLPQPVDPGHLRLRSGRAIHAPARLLYVGRLEWAKGADVLIRALGRLPRTFPWRLTIAGDGPEFSTLANLVWRIGLTDCVEFLGHIEKVGRLYRDADVVIVPSRGEGGSLVALEAMACGVPVIGSSVGGLRDLMRRYGLSRFLVLPDDPAALARAIRNFCADSGRAFRAFERVLPRIAVLHDAARISKWVLSLILRK